MYAGGEVMYPYLQGLGLSFTLEENYPHHQHLQLQLQEEEKFIHHLYDESIISDACSNNNESFADDHYYYDTQARLPTISDSSVGSNLARTPSISEYDLGGEGDLFKAPEPIMEEHTPMLDPSLTVAISMISWGEDITTTETIRVGDMEAIENEQLMSEVFFDCKNLIEKSTIEDTFPELADIKFPSLDIEVDQPKQMNNMVASEGPMQKSVSYGCLDSKKWTNGEATKPSYLNFQEKDLGAAFGIRRAYSEGDIKTMGNGLPVIANPTVLQHPYERVLTVEDYKMEERMQKLSRYRKKKTKRNFGRKIKYACRKALADNQPRVRGRFARTEECEVAKALK